MKFEQMTIELVFYFVMQSISPPVRSCHCENNENSKPGNRTKIAQ